MIDIGQFRPTPTRDSDGAGQVHGPDQNLGDVHIGDTVTDAASDQARPAEPKPMVFSGLYPIDNSD